MRIVSINKNYFEKTGFEFLILVILFSTLISLKLNAQGRGDTWCFGDSAVIKLTGNSFVSFPYCGLNSIESSASISDDNGNLLFYSGGYSNSVYGYVKCLDANHNMMPNGDSIMGDQSASNGLIILPFPNDSNRYYLFSRIGTFGFWQNIYYSIIDMSLNGGLGDVAQKNILLSNLIFAEKLAAIKHGNGRDWWLMTHQFNFNAGSDVFSSYLISPSGISNPFNQAIGSIYYDNNFGIYYGYHGEIQFSNRGDKLIAVGEEIIDLFDFDRCSGILSNHQNLATTNPPPPLDGYYGCSFSPDDSKIYISNWDNSPQVNLTCQLFQLDLAAVNIPASKTIIFTTSNLIIGMGQHQIARNNKIYIASSIGNGYPNSNFGLQNMNLSVINSPDLLGIACNYSPYSVSLGSQRCYVGLPNIPNYNLGADEGSACDTILAIDNPDFQNNSITVYINRANNFFKVIYRIPTDSHGELILFNSLGQKVLLTNLYAVQNEIEIDMNKFSGGVYFWQTKFSNKKTQTGKFILAK